MVIREFQPGDSAGCLAVFDSNTPTYFRPHEREDYEQFLSQLPGPYLVVVSDAGEVLACGGYGRDSDTTAVLTYGMVRADRHGQSLGTRLLEERLRRITTESDVPRVIVNTTQLTEGFFARFGFQTEAVTPDRYAPGLHGVRMSLQLPGWTADGGRTIGSSN
jgi:hypothetical protein